MRVVIGFGVLIMVVWCALEGPALGAKHGQKPKKPRTQTKVALTEQTFSGIDMVLVPAGAFSMGSARGEGDEAPVHRVTISKPFYIGKYEVTQGQWRAVMGANPSEFKGDQFPVENVSWGQAQEFFRRLNEREGRQVWRLPTEAEWEYACRAGSGREPAVALDRCGWYLVNSGAKPGVVGAKLPNAWGLYDMQGNVWEWCEDWYNEPFYASSPETDPAGPATGTSRVIRGGSWGSPASSCRPANRAAYSPADRYSILGLRAVRNGG